MLDFLYEGFSPSVFTLTDASRAPLTGRQSLLSAGRKAMSDGPPSWAL